jgi:LAS seventeen-binding protein 5
MQKKNKSKDTGKSQTSFKPINFEKERPAILQNIAAAQQSSTNLTNALKRLNRETQNPEDEPQIQQLYRQCRTLRKNILTYIQRTESEEWIGTLINANEELVQALSHYERALKPVEQDSDSDAWSVSDSDDEGRRAPRTQRQMSTGGSGRSVAEDLAQRLRQTSLSQSQRQEAPPPKPPRPTIESPPPKPPRPTEISPVKPPRPIPAMLPVPNFKYEIRDLTDDRGKQPVEEEEDDDPFGDSHQVHTPTLSSDRKGWLEL